MTDEYGINMASLENMNDKVILIIYYLIAVLPKFGSIN